MATLSVHELWADAYEVVPRLMIHEAWLEAEELPPPTPQLRIHEMWAESGPVPVLGSGIWAQIDGSPTKCRAWTRVNGEWV